MAERDRGRFDRRDLLKAGGAGVVGLASPAGVGAVAGRTQGGKASVTFEDQDSDGLSVVVAEVRTEVDASLFVRNEANGTVGGSGVTFAAGETATDLTVQLDEPITESQTLTVTLSESNAGLVAEDSAHVTVDGDAELVAGMDVTLVEADPDAGFNYPYFLYAPDTTTDGSSPILVEPNNTGTSTDDFAEHRERAKALIEGGLGRSVSEELRVPMLVPVFPRPRSEPVDWHHYVHQLDTETMQIDGGKLERVDRQLRRMVEHARETLSGRSYPVAEEIIMNGYSASGNFVNRFAALHPDLVTSVTGGGINGMAILPISEAKGHTLNYQIGIADLESLTGSEFDLEAFADVDQLLYMGGEDDNDTIPYDDAWSEEQREVALAVYGEDMQADRMPYCQAVYDDAGVSARFRIYEGVGHEITGEMRDDVVAFHRRSIAGENPGAEGGNVGEASSDSGDDTDGGTDDDGTDEASTTDGAAGGDDGDAGSGDDGGSGPVAAFEYVPSTPRAGQQVAFDASASSAPSGAIAGYEWTFGDGETAEGEQASHTYEDAGGYNVVLTVTDDEGRTAEAVEQVAVGDAETTSGGQPGFGVPAAVAGLGGAAYLLKRRLPGGERRQ